MSFAIVHGCDHSAQTAMNCGDIGPGQPSGELRVAAGRGFAELYQRGLAALGQHEMWRAAMIGIWLERRPAFIYHKRYYSTARRVLTDGGSSFY